MNFFTKGALGALVSVGCEANDRMYLRTQHMPVSYSMEAFVGRIVEAYEKHAPAPNR